MTSGSRLSGFLQKFQVLKLKTSRRAVICSQDFEMFHTLEEASFQATFQGGAEYSPATAQCSGCRLPINQGSLRIWVIPAWTMPLGTSGVNQIYCHLACLHEKLIGGPFGEFTTSNLALEDLEKVNAWHAAWNAKFEVRKRVRKIQGFERLVPESRPTADIVMNGRSVPPEIFLVVLSNLKGRDLPKVSRVCRAWHSVTWREQLWELVVRNEFGDKFAESITRKVNASSWRDLFIAVHLQGCFECHVPTTGDIFEVLDSPLCDDCRRLEKFQMFSKRIAKKDFGLTDGDLVKYNLKGISAPNPCGWARPMTLYFRFQLEGARGKKEEAKSQKASERKGSGESPAGAKRKKTQEAYQHLATAVNSDADMQCRLQKRMRMPAVDQGRKAK